MQIRIDIIECGLFSFWNDESDCSFMTWHEKLHLIDQKYVETISVRPETIESHSKEFIMKSNKFDRW